MDSRLRPKLKEEEEEDQMTDLRRWKCRTV